MGGDAVMASQAQQWRVLEHAFKPPVSDEAFQSMDEANPFDQQEWVEWKQEQDDDSDYWA